MGLLEEPQLSRAGRPTPFAREPREPHAHEGFLDRGRRQVSFVDAP
jgi:hypothetical protein